MLTGSSLYVLLLWVQHSNCPLHMAHRTCSSSWASPPSSTYWYPRPPCCYHPFIWEESYINTSLPRSFLRAGGPVPAAAGTAGGCNMPSQDHLLRPRQVTLMATPWDIGPLGPPPDPECWEHLPSQLSTAVLLHGSCPSIRLQCCMPTTPPGSAYHSLSTARINTVARMNWSIEEASSLDNPTQAP